MSVIEVTTRICLHFGFLKLNLALLLNYSNGSSGKVQNLLSRIPDLSFMLESSLSLPKK